MGKAPNPALLQGTLDLLILHSLQRGRMHGYTIAQTIHLLSDEVLKVEEGSLYPALQRLLVKGWVKAEWGTSENNRRARYYTITSAGKKQLGVEAENFSRMVHAIARVMQTA